MKKIIFTLIVLLSVTSCSTQDTNIVDNNIVTQNTEERNEDILSLQPDYKSDLYWKIKSVEWNIFTITEIDRSKDPTADMSPVDKKKYMQSLPEAERMALKEQIQSAILWDVKVMIPVWIPMIKKELAWEDKVDMEATLADLKPNDIVSIWYNEEQKDRKIAKFVKRSMRK